MGAKTNNTGYAQYNWYCFRGKGQWCIRLGPAQLLFTHVAIYLSANQPNASIAYVLEGGAQGAGEVLRTFQENPKHPQKETFRLISLRFEDKRDFVSLQAADMLAYELYRHVSKQLQ